MTQTTATAKIATGMTLSARSIGDYNCIFEVQVIERKNSFAKVVKIGSGEIVRCKIYEWEGREYIMPYGKYSMAPRFYA